MCSYRETDTFGKGDDPGRSFYGTFTLYSFTVMGLPYAVTMYMMSVDGSECSHPPAYEGMELPGQDVGYSCAWPGNCM